MEVTWLCMIREYVRMSQATITEYISGSPTYELCTGTERIDISSRFLMWWDQ